MRARIRHLVVTAALIAGSLGLPLAAGAPAHAAACPPGTGVTVVVERAGVKQVRCDAGGGNGETAFDNLNRVGFAATGSSQYGSSVLCGIDGYPSSQPCPMPPANAYWGFFHAHVVGENWSYSTQGVNMKMSRGQWIGFRFPGDGKNPPTVDPTSSPAPKPTTPKPATPKPTAAQPSSDQPSSDQPSASSGPAPSASSGAPGAPDSRDSESSSRSESPAASDAVDADRGDGTEAAGPVEDVIDFVAGEDSAAWVPVTVTIALVIALGAGAAVAARRRAS